MSNDLTPSTYHFKGFDSPNGTIVPDDVFDVLMPRLTDPELRVLLYIIRRTFGFKKQRDNISLRQMVKGITTRDGRVLDGGTGMSKASVARGLKGLIQKGVITASHNHSRERGNEPTTYALRFRHGGVSQLETRGASQVETGPVSLVDPQQTARQQTEISLSKNRRDQSSIERSRANQPAAGGGNPPEALSQLTALTVASRGHGRMVADPGHDVIAAYISDFSHEFHDLAPLQSSTTRAYNLFVASGVPIETFVEGLHRARAIVKERARPRRSVNVAGGGTPAKRQMAYFFAVLENLLRSRDAARDILDAPQR